MPNLPPPQRAAWVAAAAALAPIFPRFGANESGGAKAGGGEDGRGGAGKGSGGAGGGKGGGGKGGGGKGGGKGLRGGKG